MGKSLSTTDPGITVLLPLLSLIVPTLGLAQAGGSGKRAPWLMVYAGHPVYQADWKPAVDPQGNTE